MQRLAINLLLLAASTGISLLIGELACRALFPQIGWRMFPDVDLGWSSREYGQFDPLESSGREGAARILFLGDSNLAGSGVSALDKRFPILWRDRLGGAVDVQIFATGGWGTDQQFLAFLEKGIEWGPDIVVLAFCASNDISNIVSNTHISRTLERRTLKPYFVVENNSIALFDGRGKPLTEVPRSGEEARSQSYLIDLIRFLMIPRRFGESTVESLPEVDSRYTRFGDPSKTKPKQIRALRKELNWSPEQTVTNLASYIHEDFYFNAYQWELFEGILGLLNHEVESAGAKLVTMLLPASYYPADPRFHVGSGFEFHFGTPAGGFTFRTNEPRERLREICDRLEISFFDPTADFLDVVEASGSFDEVWPDPYDRHFSDRGHEILASLLEAFMSTWHKGGRST